MKKELELLQEEKLNKNFDKFLSDLDEMVKIPSVYQEDESKYPFGKNIYLALEKMINICKNLNMKTFIEKDGYYGYAEIGEGEKLLGVLGHLDVVPAGNLEEWNTDPFKPQIIEGKCYGRGVQDDKGPTLAAIYALKTLLDCGFKLNYRVRFIFGTDEENLWRDMPKYMEKEEIPTLGFTPDSKFPLIYSEKGLLQCKLIAKNESGIILKGGDAFNCVPSRLVVEKNEKIVKALENLNYGFKENNKDIEIIGKSVHAQIAEEGINSINRYFHALTLSGKETKTGRFISDNIINYKYAEPIFGEVSDEHSGKLKFNIGKVELNENEEIIGVDIRIPVTYDKEKVVEALKKKAKKYGFKYVEHDYLKSIYTPLNSELVKVLMESYQEITKDTKSKAISSGGATYARAMDNCVAFGSILPNGPKTEHQPNEYIILEDIKTAMKIYMRAFEKFNN